jgi:hypothetical protein
MSLEHDALPEREAIHQETDIEVLRDWHENALDLFDSLKSQIAAFNMFEYHDDEDYDWATRAQSKVGYAGTTLRRIERRIVEIGLDLPITVDRKERQRIRSLENLVGFLQRLCERNNIEHGTSPVTYSKGDAA